MGICLSRRAMQAGSNEHAAAEAEADSAGVPSSKFRNRHGKGAATGNEAEMINPARLLLESPRISTGEMGMLGLFFQKKYCKPLQHHQEQQQQHGYEKLTPMEKKKAECELGLEADMSATMMTANVLFEKDEYPTFEPNFRAAAAGQAAVESEVAAGRVENEEDARRSKDSNAVNEGGGCSRGDQMWLSAGEDFFSDWEDRSERGSSGIRGPTSVASGVPEIGVFEAEQYFKEEPRASDGSCFDDASNNNDAEGSSTSEALLRSNKQPAEASRGQLKRPSSAVKSPGSSGSGGSGVGSSSGIRWASSCTAASAVQIDGEAFLDHGRTLRRAKSKAEQQLSKMFKLLGSSSSSQAKHKPRNSMATTTTTRTTGKRQQQQKSNGNAKPCKSSKIRESHVKDWMDKARKSSDGIFALGQEDQQRCDQKPSSNNEQQPQHTDLNPVPGNPANAAAHHHQPLTPQHSATGGQPVGFTFSGSTTDSSAVGGALNESATSTHNQGFGSPFPASPSSDQKQQQQQQPEEPRIVVSAVASSSSSRDRLPARVARPRAKSRSIIQHDQVVVVEGDVGNDSDSSSDLFELDSVTTSLSSARSSLSRLSSARSSIRKSTADEQDLLQLQFCDNKAVLAATLRANVLESSPAAARAALACNAGGDAAAAENATKNHQDSSRERVSLTDSQAIIGSRGVSAAAAAGGGITTANEENKPPPPTSRRAKSEIRLSLNARSVPWNNSNGVLAVQT